MGDWGWEGGRVRGLAVRGHEREREGGRGGLIGWGWGGGGAEGRSALSGLWRSRLPVEISGCLPRHAMWGSDGSGMTEGGVRGGAGVTDDFLSPARGADKGFSVSLSPPLALSLTLFPALCLFLSRCRPFFARPSHLPGASLAARGLSSYQS